MKRIIAFSLCLFICLSLAACNSGDEKQTHGVDIAYFAEMGTFPECDYRIKDSIPDVNAEDSPFMAVTDKQPPYVTDGSYSFYYDASAKNQQITKIASFGACLGFETGSIIIEITDALDEQGIKYTEREPKKNELFFLPSGGERTVIECKDLKNPLIFVFEDNALCAVLIG